MGHNSSEMVNTGQAATMLGLKKNTLDIWRLRGVGPKFVKMGRTVRYRLADIEDFIQSHTIQKTNSRKSQSHVLKLGA